MNTLSLFPELASPTAESGNTSRARIKRARTKNKPAIARQLGIVEEVQIKMDPHMHIAKRLADDLAEQHRRAQYRSACKNKKRGGPSKAKSAINEKSHDAVVGAICEHLRASLAEQIAAEPAHI